MFLGVLRLILTSQSYSEATALKTETEDLYPDWDFRSFNQPLQENALMKICHASTLSSSSDYTLF
jgi:hypothetical protein